ncbi:NEL-type E3 ubiquitin ligase domain-containing protein [Pseudomonas akapageensis]|uniref:NEL-type E3 ubiquitin ligase domain-containing protein n=1 Tax=Pseudomonas akapageensis TaxID=2609961 RepID=UPI00140DCE3F|nr:NEL-type E3 ubiquitin ligase domain-containing protein [Pseudomonas akapageensis]
MRQNLPAWLTSADPAAVKALSDSLLLSHQSQNKVRQLLKGLRGIHEFAAPLLTEALRKQFGDGLNIYSDYYLQGRTFVVKDLHPVGNRDYRSESFKQSLLQAALHNFEAREDSSWSATEWRRLGRSDNRPLPVQIQPEQFVDLCRSLDLGAKYQAHLNAVFNPAASAHETAVQAQARVRSVLKDSMRHDLAVAAYIAVIKQQIPGPVYRMLLETTELNADVTLDGLVVRHKRLSMLGEPLSNIMLFETWTPTGTFDLYAQQQYRLSTLVMYIPDDPLSPLKTFATWDACELDLKERLEQADYRRFFYRFVQRKDMPSFLPELEQALKEKASLRLGTYAITGDTFDEMVRLSLEKIMVDARFLAVPTADEDLKTLQKKRQQAQTVGLNLLSAASFFVPGLAEIVLGVTVFELMREVYHGYEDWQDGHRHEALARLTGVAEVVALGGLIGVATAATSRFFEELLPIELAEGQSRLWHLDLAPYQVDPALIAEASESEQGLLDLGSQHYVQMDGKTYSVYFEENLGKWRIRHPARAQAYAPVLEHNGAGAWRAVLENPLQWQGSHYLFRRLGTGFATLDNESIDQALAVTGLDETALRQIHLCNAKPPGALLDTISRLQLDRQVNRFIQQLETSNPTLSAESLLANIRTDSVLSNIWDVLDAQQSAPGSTEGTNEPHPLTVRDITARAKVLRPTLFDSLYKARNQPAPGAEATLCRDFPGLPLPVARQLIETATEAERVRLTTELRVPLRMAEAAQEHLREIRLNRAIEGFYLDSVSNPDTEKLALHLLDKLPDWEGNTWIEVREQSFDGTLIDSIGDVSATWRPVVVKNGAVYQAFGADRQPLTFSMDGPDGLYASLLGSVVLADTETADDLRLALAQLAAEDRRQAAQMLGQAAERGWFNAPRRLSDSQLGYPLSGRGAPTPNRTSLVDQARRLYPDFSDNQIDNLLRSLRIGGTNARTALLRRQHEFERLDKVLSRWEHEAVASSSLQMPERVQVGNTLRRCWRRQVPRLDRPDGSLLGYRLSLEGSQIGQLPEFPAGTDFSHVVDLNLHNANLRDVPQGFMQCFSRIQWLDLSNNELTALPTMIGLMTELRGLNLQANQIRLNSADIVTLSRLSRLEELNLSLNPIGEVPDVSHLNLLRILRLRGTRIDRLPTGLLSRLDLVSVDLRDNLIRELPDTLFSADPRQVQQIVLHDNPLSDTSLERLTDYQARTGVGFRGHRHNPSPESARAYWLPEPNDPQWARRQDRWKRLAAEPGSQDFMRLFGDLTTTSDFQLVREDLTRRVWEVIDKASANSKLRKVLFELAASPRSCSDSVLLNFSALEVKTLVFHALCEALESKDSSALLVIAHGLFRLEKLEQIARRDIAARPVIAGVPAVDEIEVSLAYRTGLANRLALPGQPRSMRYEAIAGISAADLDAAYEEVLTAEPAQLQDFIAERDFWIEFLEKKYAIDFATTEQPFRVRESVLLEQQDDLTSAEFDQRYRDLGKAREEAKRALIKRLTEHEQAPESR